MNISKAPETVWYHWWRADFDGLTFHRIIPGFDARGDPEGTGMGGQDMASRRIWTTDLRIMILNKGIISMAS